MVVVVVVVVDVDWLEEEVGGAKDNGLPVDVVVVSLFHRLLWRRFLRVPFLLRAVQMDVGNSIFGPVLLFTSKTTMPREIITLQAGQCGNQSEF